MTCDLNMKKRPDLSHLKLFDLHYNATDGRIATSTFLLFSFA